MGLCSEGETLCRTEEKCEIQMTEKRKKVIIVTYYWPPAGGIGVLRCLKIAKYLLRHGWEPVIFTSSTKAYQFLDPNNNADVPAGIEVIRVSAFNPIAFFKRISGRKKEVPLIDIMATPAVRNRWIDGLGIWIRGNFFIPDARSLWIRPATRSIRKWLKTHRADAIFSDGPPHTNTVVANNIAEEFNLPWVADFQDPWTQVDYYGHMKIGPRADRIHRRLEQRVFGRADFITIASPTWASDLKAIGAQEVGVLYYGYDEEDFTDYAPQQTKQPVVFHGGLLGDDRYPAPLVEALSQLKQEGFAPLEDLKIKLAGGVSPNVVARISEAGFEKELTLLGMVSRDDVIREMAQAGFLLLPVNIASNCKGRIPGKLFEMMRSGKPILALGPIDGDVAHLLRITGTGETFAYDDVEGVKQFLRLYCSGNSPYPKRGGMEIRELSNEAGAQQIAALLDRVSRKTQ